MSFVINNKTPSKYLIIEPVVENEDENFPFEMSLYEVTGTIWGHEKDENPTLEFLQKYIKLELEGVTGDTLHRLDNYSVKEYLLNDTTEIEHLNNEGLNNRVQEYLKHDVPVDILVKFTLKNLHSINLIRVKSISIEGWKIVAFKLTANQKEAKSNRYINCIIEELIKSADQDLTASLLSVMENQDSNSQSLLEAVSLDKLFGAVNRSTLENRQILNLARWISTHPEFNTKVNVLSLIPLLDSEEMTLVGLDFIMELLKVSECDMTLLSNKLSSSLVRISEIRNPNYTQERQKGNYHLTLETALFSDYYFKEVENEVVLEKELTNRIMSKFVMLSNSSWRKYIIDLTSEMKIDSIMLFFENNNLKKHLLIQIYKATSNTSKELIYKGYYEEWIWQQLCKYSSSEETKKIIENPERFNLNALQFHLEDVTSRYLIIELNFDLVGLMDGFSKSLCTSEIIP